MCIKEEVDYKRGMKLKEYKQRELKSPTISKIKDEGLSICHILLDISMFIEQAMKL